MTKSIRAILSLAWGVGASVGIASLVPLPNQYAKLFFAILCGALVTAVLIGFEDIRESIGKATQLAGRKLHTTVKVKTLLQSGLERLRHPDPIEKWENILVIVGALSIVTCYSTLLWLYISHPFLLNEFSIIIPGAAFLINMLVYLSSILEFKYDTDLKESEILRLLKFRTFIVTPVGQMCVALTIFIFCICVAGDRIVRYTYYIVRGIVRGMFIGVKTFFSIIFELLRALLSLITNLWWFIQSDRLITYSSYGMILSGVSYYLFVIKMETPLGLTVVSSWLLGAAIGGIQEFVVIPLYRKLRVSI